MVFRKFLFVLSAMLLVTACSDSNNNGNLFNRDEPVEVRVTHASPDAPGVNVYIDGELALENLQFKQSSGLVNLDEAGTVEVEVRGLLPDGSELTVIGPVALEFLAGERTDIVAFNNLLAETGALSIMPKVLDPVEIEEDIDDVRVSVMHAAPEVGTVDIYVTAPDGGLEGVAPITAGFGDAAGPLALPPGEYRVRVTPTGTVQVAYDSGAVTLEAGSELLLVAVENTLGVGDSPVGLLAVGAEGAGEIFSAGTGAEVRVVHNSADTPAVDILVNGMLALDAVPFPAASEYDDLQAPPGTYNVVVAADADNSIQPIDVDVTLEAGRSYTVIAVGSLAEDTLQPVLTDDDRQKQATAAGLEVIHGSYLLAAEIPVDVYLTADGVIADAEPAIEGLAYTEATGLRRVSPGSYWVTVTAAGDRSVVAFDSGAALPLDAGVNYTVIARDPAAEEGTGSPLINATILAD